MLKKPHRVNLIPLAVLLLVSAVVSNAQSTISVSGEAEVRVVPDEVVLSLGMETVDKDLKTAKALNDARIKQALAAARKYGVQPQHVQTDFLNIEPIYRRSDLTAGVNGYVVRKTIVVILKDVKRFEDLLSDVLEAGINHVHGIEFRTTELRKHRDQARALALKAAREKATDLAREAGKKLGAVQSIGEASYYWYSGYNSYWGRGYGGGSNVSQNVVQSSGSGSGSTDGESSIALGQIKVTARISASFVLE